MNILISWVFFSFIKALFLFVYLEDVKKNKFDIITLLDVVLFLWYLPVILIGIMLVLIITTVYLPFILLHKIVLKKESK